MAKWQIYNFKFPNQYLMCATLIRFQEFYESPKFRGKEFSLEEYMDWYASVHDGVFSYFDDWKGFNFPSRVVNEISKWRQVLGAKERLFLDQLSSDVDSLEDDFYVIGTEDEAPVSDLVHEMVHALYYLNPDYAKKVDELVIKHSEDLSPLLEFFEDIGYHRAVFRDETNAWILSGLPDEVKIRVWPQEEFENLFQGYFGFPVSQLHDEKWVRRKIHTVRMGGSIKRKLKDYY